MIVVVVIIIMMLCSHFGLGLLLNWLIVIFRFRQLILWQIKLFGQLNAFKLFHELDEGMIHRIEPVHGQDHLPLIRDDMVDDIAQLIII